MTQQITFYDTTLRDGEQTIGVNFSIEDKVAIAMVLEAYGVSAIEAGFPAASQKDFDAVVKIAQTITQAKVVGLARLVRSDIDQAIQATRMAKCPAIHLFIATSPVHRDYKLHMTPDEIIAAITKEVTYARQLVPDVIFSPEDATRTELPFLASAVQAAIAAGATMINIPDTVGYDTPEEYGAVFDYLQAHVAGYERVGWSTHTHNDLGMATANALMGVAHGANEIQGTINGIGERAGNVDVIEAAAALYVRQRAFERQTPIQLPQSKAISDLVAHATHMPVARNKPIVGCNAFAHESGIHQDGYLKHPATYEILKPEMVGAKASLPLGKLSGSHAVMQKLTALGFPVTREMMATIFPTFKQLAEVTDIVSDQQIQAMMQEIFQKEMVGKS